MPPGSPDSTDEDSCWSRGCPKYVSEKFLGFVLPAEEELPEVEIINNYAVFMGYLSMAVRGLAFLVVTWTTVVLLGGFVSDLGKKDFWCLTVITLSQVAGVFNVFHTEKMDSIWHAFRGLFITCVTTTIYRATADSESGAKTNIIMRKATSFFRRQVVIMTTEDVNENVSSRRMKMAYAFMMVMTYAMFWLIVSLTKAAVQALLLAAVLLPMATLYMLGLYISTSISLWRLIKRDYGGDGGANMKAALNVLYSLTVVQGVVYGYMIYFARQERSMVMFFAERLIEHGDVVAVTWDYLRKTKKGCEMHPSFARGRNLVTYAVDMIESSSPARYLSGTRALDMLLVSTAHGALIRQIIACGGSSRVLQKLLGTLGPGSPYCGETRRHAASIVAHLASQKQIRLAQFPGGIHLISSMIDDTSLVDDGLRTLEHLADDEGNRIVMCDTPGILSSVIKPLGGLHPDHCRGWDRISALISRLTAAAPPETGLKLRSEISRNDTAVGALQSILRCGECDPGDRIKANDILADLSLEMTRSEEYKCLIFSFRARKEENLIAILVDNFIDVDRDDQGTQLRVDFAGSKLAELSLQSKSIAQLILKTNHAVATSLIAIVENKAHGSTIAETILINLCSHYSKDDACFDKLKKALTDAMPKVLGEMLPLLTAHETRTGGTEVQSSIVLWTPAGDSEIGYASQDEAMNGEKDEGPKLKETLTFFCFFGRICDKLISADPQHLSSQFDDIAAAICLDSAKPVRTLASLVQEANEALEAIEAQEALDENKRADDRKKLPLRNHRKHKGILDCFFARATSWTDEDLAEKTRAQEREIPHSSGFCTAPLPEP